MTWPEEYFNSQYLTTITEFQHFEFKKSPHFCILDTCIQQERHKKCPHFCILENAFNKNVMKCWTEARAKQLQSVPAKESRKCRENRPNQSTVQLNASNILTGTRQLKQLTSTKSTTTLSTKTTNRASAKLPSAKNEQNKSVKRVWYNAGIKQRPRPKRSTIKRTAPNAVLLLIQSMQTSCYIGLWHSYNYVQSMPLKCIAFAHFNQLMKQIFFVYLI